jgi:hypothetical protein
MKTPKNIAHLIPLFSPYKIKTPYHPTTKIAPIHFNIRGMVYGRSYIPTNKFQQKHNAK